MLRVYPRGDLRLPRPENVRGANGFQFYSFSGQ
jgi:hypothetical protein